MARTQLDLFVLDVLISQQMEPPLIAEQLGMKYTSITRALERLRDKGDKEAIALIPRWRRAREDYQYVKLMHQFKKW